MQIGFPICKLEAVFAYMVPLNCSNRRMVADYTAGFFYDDARAATESVLRKGSVPIVVGGTGMYLRW